ncbi:hypothetical protein M3P05_10300 [Sansalvadorimonas sp. 2012CJ34-2]|uniref:Uncharacterized protein n=1 Tax=Parendozoicomonas callyspongiae TaxID=2942213 RepID=A0ABT0PG62_9GAMM|nr:hypothetical protein [Sansalvadorimonas sp. 2012CJ34-2]MCL6270310.1 hypothetical protein [Sansalvadorimonas sp. 2012CJ34-2]
MPTKDVNRVTSSYGGKLRADSGRRYFFVKRPVAVLKKTVPSMPKLEDKKWHNGTLTAQSASADWPEHLPETRGAAGKTHETPCYHWPQSQIGIESTGGEIVRVIFSFPGGRRFHFTEPSGNEFAVWSDK